MSPSERQDTSSPDSSEIPDQTERVRELQRFALAKLPAMQLGDGTFCREMDADEHCRASGRSLRYTLICLIGLLRAEEHDIEQPFHLGALRSKFLSELSSPELTAGDLGLALWAESRADGSAIRQLVGVLEQRLSTSAGSMDRLITMELAWMVIGLSEAAARGEIGGGAAILSRAREELVTERNPGSGLLFHQTRGPRRRFPHFADQIYGLIALCKLARNKEDEEALEAARRLGDKLVALQMGDGAWPWICDPIRGTIVEPYEIYSIHQDSMAMMGLQGLTSLTGDERYRMAAVAGLDWNYGNNVLGAQMFDREVGLIYRSIRRKQTTHRVQQARNAARTYLRSEAKLPPASSLEVNRTMRPYHLGWILEAWAGREELAAL